MVVVRVRWRDMPSLRHCIPSIVPSCAVYLICIDLIIAISHSFPFAAEPTTANDPWSGRSPITGCGPLITVIEDPVKASIYTQRPPATSQRWQFSEC